MPFKVRVGQHVFDHLTRVPIPDVIFSGHPLWGSSRLWERVFVLEGGALPPNVTKPDGVNLSVKILMISDRRRIAMRNECGSP